ncbi:hypothetical protein [Mannheimia granulomatis]|uniref:hypothetical protein n=1 Tax=Mannheimia granulomatis TaxID=85402 RepID=UPI00047C5BDC|nr:hypothetical protein [Mannheimia granulomatis]QLB19773.1 hypothetical protein A6B41_10115 [Mannheimia granulomatis]
MKKETVFLLISVLIALVIVPISYLFSVIEEIDEFNLLAINTGILAIVSGCSFLVYFLRFNPKIRHAFIGGAALTAAAIQAWVIYGVLLSNGDPKGTVVLFQLYLFSSVGPLLLSSIWAFSLPPCIYPLQGGSVKYALFGGLTTAINYVLTLFIFYVLTI